MTFTLRPTKADAGAELCALVCDDDRVTRGVISELLAERGVRVLAETDRAFDALDLIERFQPGLVVTDMALESGSGMEVVEFLAERQLPCQVVVFTAFEEMVRPAAGVGVRVVSKPGFEELEAALDAAIRDTAETVVGQERRRPVRAVPSSVAMRQATGLDDAAEFYRRLADAAAGDALLAIRIGDADPSELVGALRKAVRVQDLVVQRQDRLIAFLIGGGAEGPPAVLRRLGESHPSVVDGATFVELDPAVDPPADSFAAL